MVEQDELGGKRGKALLAGTPSLFLQNARQFSLCAQASLYTPRKQFFLKVNTRYVRIISKASANILSVWIVKLLFAS